MVRVHGLPAELASRSGMVLIPVFIDLTVGEEVGLYWLDRTPFVRELAAIRPFQLFVRGGLFHAERGFLCSLGDRRWRKGQLRPAPLSCLPEA